MEEHRTADFYEYEYVTDFNIPDCAKDLSPVFLLVDTSRSMACDHKIEQLEEAIEKIACDPVQLNMYNPDVVIKVSMLCFDDTPRWEAQVQDLKEIADIVPRLRFGGHANLGAAFEELDKKLSRKELIQKGTCSGYKRPVIILLSDGVYSDDISAGISALVQNDWFVKAMRFAFAIGDDANIECLERFTGHPKTVLSVDVNTRWDILLTRVALLASSFWEYMHDLSIGEDPVMQAWREKNFRLSAEEAAELLMSINSSLNTDPAPDPNPNPFDPNGDPFGGFGFSTN